jgi:hypothetical protein
MKKKSDDYAGESFRSTSLTSRRGRAFYHLARTIELPLAATSLSTNECEKIQSKAINASLSKCGLSRKTSRAVVVFGAPWFGGLGWRHLYLRTRYRPYHAAHQAPSHSWTFQSLLQISLHWYQVISGVSFSPLYMPSITLTISTAHG